MPEPAHEEIRRVFDVVFDAEPEDREAVLARECGGDDALRQRVRAMIAAGEERFLADPTAASRPTVDGSGAFGSSAAATAASLPGSEQPGEVIGRYKLLQLIGEGGFGRVWMAEQREPVRRRVAVKVIRIGMDTEQVIARFEAERQALAMMDHPNIAKVLDAGATATGRPYFVMEYIRGVSLVEYCDTEQLDTAARLDLFARVCQAIQHAHQKGIIHRDIKPGNVLVTMHDGAPVPKVIDFGIAKATSQELTTRTLFTEHRQMIGTPAYMSPEQAEMSGLDIDTRSDIYSLGVLLYELLTGTTPFDVRTLMDAGFAEMVRIIREETPAKPSTRLSTLGDTAARVAARRRADPERLGGRLRGDLDWIVMKCLEKDRTRRYETAMALADDVRRHLDDEPVRAGPPSTAYRLHKFVRRNRAAVGAAGLVLAVLVLGIAGTSTGFVLARAEATRADEAAEEARQLAASEAEARATAEQLATSEAAARAVAEESERRATSATARAERELARAVEIKQLILTMFDGIRPQVARGTDISLLKGIIDDAAARLAAGAIGDELVAAELHSVVGNAYLQLRLVEEAARHLPVTLEIRERRLPPDDPAAVLAAQDMAMLRSSQNRREEAVGLYEAVLERMRTVFGPESNMTLNVMNNLGSVLLEQGRDVEALALFEEVLDGRRRTLGDDHSDTVRTLSFLGLALKGLERFDEAAIRLERALERQLTDPGDDHPDTLGTMTTLAFVRVKQGRLDEAEALATRALEHRLVVTDVDSGFARTAQQTMAAVAEARGRMAEASATREALLEGSGSVGAMVNLALLRKNEGRMEEAESLLREALELGEEHLEVRTDSVLNARDALISLLLRQGRAADARPLLERSLAIHRISSGLEHPRTLEAMQRLASVSAALGDLPTAEAVARERLEILRGSAGPGAPVTLRAANNLGRFIDDQGRPADAEPLYLECLDGVRALHGDQHQDLIPPLMNLAILYWNLERHDDAEAAYLEVIGLRARHLGPEHPLTLGATTDLGSMLVSAGRPADAVVQLERSLPVKRRVLGPAHPWTGFASRSLAAAYLALGRTEDAIPLQRARIDAARAAADAEDAAADVIEAAARLLLEIEPAELRQPDDALVYAERATALREESGGAPLAGALAGLAAARAAAGDLAGAVEAQRRAIALTPESERSLLQETLEGYLEARSEEPAGG